MFGVLNRILGRESHLVVPDSVLRPDPFPEIRDRSDLERLAVEFARGRDGFDFTLESLKHLDNDILEKRKSLLKDKSGLQRPELGNFIVGAGSYLSEVLLRSNSAFDVVGARDIEASDLGISVEDIDLQVAAVVTRSTGGTSFPFAKVLKFIENGPEDATWFFVEVVLSKLKEQT